MSSEVRATNKADMSLYFGSGNKLTTVLAFHRNNVKGFPV